MAKSKTANGKKKNIGINVKLKIVVEKLQKSVLLSKKTATNVPEDVKEGQFAVIAVDDDELKRFVIPLSYLTHPTFLRLLEQAAEEFGFDHEGALTIPCRPSQLERILADQCWPPVEERPAGDSNYWGSCNKTMVKSC